MQKKLRECLDRINQMLGLSKSHRERRDTSWFTTLQQKPVEWCRVWERNVQDVCAAG